MKKSFLSLFTLALLIHIIHLSHAQTNLVPARFAFESDSGYNKNIPSPHGYLGYELGTDFTLYAYVEQYIKALAASSPRVSVHQYGSTYEGRKLYSLVVTSEENQRNIDKILEVNQKIAHSQNLTSDEKQDILDSHPVTISFSYNIHGNEASSTEAAMQVAYQLAASNDDQNMEILNNSVILIFPCINPDGRDRYVYWYNSMRRKTTGIEPADLEHQEPWPNGRTNHYWFDLNRDWVWGVHPESRGHTTEYMKWMPHLHTDYHEMGYNANYFTVPGTTPRNKFLPDQHEPLSDTIGQANAKAFDTHKINYFTREAFDFFYPGYGSSYPSVMGAIGMLTEQGGIGAGVAIETDDGTTLTFRQRIFDHYLTSFATIRKAVERRRHFLDYSIAAHNPVNSKSNVTAYILSNNGDPFLKDAIRVLTHHKVEIHVAENDFAIQAKNFRTNESSRTNVKKNDYIISTQQPRHLLINSIFNNTMEIEDSVMYDMSTWSLPMAYNLECFETTVPLTASLKKLTEYKPVTGQVIQSGAGYAYTMDWNQRYAPKALSKLWEKGYRVRCTTKPFYDGNKWYSAGTLIILKGRNLEYAETIDQDIETIAKDAGVIFTGHDSGRMKDGIDLASRDSRPLKNPKAAMLVGPPFNSLTNGQIYFLMDVETEFPLERVRTDLLEQTAIPKFGSRYGLADLNRYDVLVLAGGGNQLNALFDEEHQKVLKDWIEAGGTLVATETAASFFTSKASKISMVELSTPPADSSLAAKIVRFEDRQQYFGQKRTPGTALHARVDNSHPLAFGVKSDLYTLKFGDDALQPSAAFQSVGLYADVNMLASGYLPTHSENHLKGKAFAGVQNIGRGKVVYLVDNTQFRMFWLGPSKMMQNAIMLMPSM